MTVDQICLVDSDVFITAKNLYYAFDICPGFWKSVVHHHRAGRVFSTDRVRGELLAGHKTEDLVQWMRTEVQKGFFILVVTDLVMSATFSTIGISIHALMSRRIRPSLTRRTTLFERLAEDIHLISRVVWVSRRL